jgi:hypothetical protein
MPPGLSRSTDLDLKLPVVCELPMDSLLSPPASPTPPLSIGASERRPLVDICVIHMLDEIAVAESSLEFALVIVVGGTWPSITIPEGAGVHGKASRQQ